MSSYTCNNNKDEVQAGWPQFWAVAEEHQHVCTSTASVDPGLELRGSSLGQGGQVG